MALIFDVNVAILLEIGAFKALMIDLLISLDIGVGINTAVAIHCASIVTKAVSLLPIIFCENKMVEKISKTEENYIRVKKIT